MTSFELADGQREALDDLAEQSGRARGEILRRALQEYLAREGAAST